MTQFKKARERRSKIKKRELQNKREKAKRQLASLDKEIIGSHTKMKKSDKVIKKFSKFFTTQVNDKTKFLRDVCNQILFFSYSIIQRSV